MNNDLKNQLQNVLKQLLRYRIGLFLLVVLLVYGFIVWRVDTLKNAQPSAAATALQAKPAAAQPHINQSTVNKIQQLQNNSVNVQALFNHARNNPFQE
ncbi:MAG: hypothetical protein ACREGA_03250 [Candidatus Saccharimonadales bacterium]